MFSFAARAVLRPWAVLGWASLAALPLAIANAPPADQSATPPVTTPSSSQPAATPAEQSTTSAQAAPAAADGTAAAGTPPSGVGNPDLIDKRLRAQGYKPEMRHGEKYYCRVTDTLGSRVQPVKACSTAEAILRKEQEAKDLLQWAQRTSTMCPSNDPKACK
jgi:hypothetical protein